MAKWFGATIGHRIDDYQFKLYDVDCVWLGDLDVFRPQGKRTQFGQYGGVCTFSLPLKSRWAEVLKESALHFLRVLRDGRVIFEGAQIKLERTDKGTDTANWVDFVFIPIARLYLYWRTGQPITGDKLSVTDLVDDAMKWIVERTCGATAPVSPGSSLARAYPNFTVAGDKGEHGTTVTINATGSNIYEILQKYAEAHDVDWDVVFDDNIAPEFETWYPRRGTDKTQGQATEVIWTDEIAGIEEQRYGWDAMEMPTLVVDQAYSTDAVSSADIRGRWLLREKILIVTDTDELAVDLEARKLAEFYVLGRFRETVGNQWGKHWFVGDTITWQSNRMGFGPHDDLISEVAWEIDADGWEHLRPTLGKREPTATQYLRGGGSSRRSIPDPPAELQFKLRDEDDNVVINHTTGHYIILEATDGSITTAADAAAWTLNIDLPTPGTLTVATADSAPGPHTHAITSSNDVSLGGGAVILASDVNGDLILHALQVTDDLTVDTNGKGLVMSDVTANKILVADGTRYVPADLDSIAGHWTVAAGEIYTTVANKDVVPLGGTGTIGQIDDYWDGAYIEKLYLTATDTLSLVGPDMVLSATAINVIRAGANVIFQSGGANNRWQVTAAGHFEPVTGASFDIGLDGAKVRAIYAIAGDFTGDVTIDTSGKGLVMSDVTAGKVLIANGTRYVPADLSSISGHAVLSATHTDSLTAGVSRGSIIIGNVTPKWAELVIGAANTHLESNGTDVSWVLPDIYGTPGTLTVSTGNAAGATHTHAVTSSANPGAVASILASTANGYLELVRVGPTATEYIKSFAANRLNIVAAQDVVFTAGGVNTLGVNNAAVLPTAASGTIESGLTGSRWQNVWSVLGNYTGDITIGAGAGLIYSVVTAGYHLVSDGTRFIPTAPGAPVAHDILSAQHGDTLAAGVSRGSIIVGNATPKWAELTIGAADTYLGSDGTDADWAQITHGQLGGVGTDDHHAEVHVVNSTGPHAEAGLTIGHVLRASGAAAFAFAELQHGDLGGVGAADHQALVTLHATLAANLLGLSTQELTLDSQAATLVFAGPAAGGAAAPTFRSLVTGDLPAPSAHDILSAQHGDTLAAGVSRGSLIYGNATPKWGELIVGAANTHLESDGTDVSWVLPDIYGTPGTLTVATGNVAGATHTHAITSSHSPGAAAAILATAGDGHIHIAGKLYLETGTTEYIWQQAPGGITVAASASLSLSVGGSLQLNVLAAEVRCDAALTGTISLGTATARWSNVYSVLGNYTGDITIGTGVGIIHADSVAAGKVLIADGTRFVPADLSSISAHDVLSATHTDTVAAGVSRGSIIVGNITPKWTELVIGANERYLGSDGTDATWSQVDHGHLSGVGADDHHAEIHVVNSTGPHAEAGLTIGHVLRVSGAAAFSFAELQHGDLGGVGTGDHQALVTIDADLAANLLGLAAQELSLDDQAANLVFAGPAAGGAAAPAFRSLITADLPAPAAHDILSAQHGDSLAAGVSQGSIVRGNATPKWSELTIGAANSHLQSDGATFAWQDDVTFATGKGIIYTDGNEVGKVLAGDNTRYVPTTIASLIGHNLLSPTHSDTETAGAARGALVYGAADNVWRRLSAGAAGTHLESDGTDVAWVAPHWTVAAGEIYTTVANKDVVPNGGTGEIGQTDDRWDGGFFEAIAITGTATFAQGSVGSVGNDLFVLSNDDLKLEGTDQLLLTAGGNILVQPSGGGTAVTINSTQFYPNPTLTIDLGLSSFRWKKFWVDDIDCDGSIIMDAGETVAGVDLPAFKTAYDAHTHNYRKITDYTGGGNHIVSSTFLLDGAHDPDSNWLLRTSDGVRVYIKDDSFNLVGGAGYTLCSIGKQAHHHEVDYNDAQQTAGPN